MSRRFKVLLAACVVAVLAVGGLVWRNGAVDRELANVAQEVFDLGDFADEGKKVELAGSSVPGVSCNGREDRFTSYSRRVEWRSMDEDVASGAERIVQALIADGWRVQRRQSTRRAFDAVRTGWIVTASFSPDELGYSGPLGLVQISVVKRPSECMDDLPRRSNEVDKYSSS